MPGDDKFHLNSPARFYANVSKGVGGGEGGWGGVLLWQSLEKQVGLWVPRSEVFGTATLILSL